jgi:hypothetical protein
MSSGDHDGLKTQARSLRPRHSVGDDRVRQPQLRHVPAYRNIEIDHAVGRQQHGEQTCVSLAARPVVEERRRRDGVRILDAAYPDATGEDDVTSTYDGQLQTRNVGELELGCDACDGRRERCLVDERRHAPTRSSVTASAATFVASRPPR